MYSYFLYKTRFGYPDYFTTQNNPPQQLQAATASSVVNGLLA